MPLFLQPQLVLNCVPSVQLHFQYMGHCYHPLLSLSTSCLIEVKDNKQKTSVTVRLDTDFCWQFCRACNVTYGSV